MALYQGYSDADGCMVLKDCKPLLPDRSLGVWNHSPSGFAWGYCGSGPAQLALALLLEELPEERAVYLHQSFKFQAVAAWKGPTWACTSEGIRAWAAKQRSEPVEE
jgi:Family of unknown function (DUF6166)